MDAFTPTDSDLVFRRTGERAIMLAVFILEGFVFAGVTYAVLTTEPDKAMPIILLMVAVVLSLGVLTAWMWTYEVRLTPYEFVLKSIFGQKVVPLSSVIGLERRRVKGKNPPQFVLNVRTADAAVMKVADLKRDGKWLHETMREKCKSLKHTEFSA